MSLFYIFLVWAIPLTLPVLVITVPDLLELVGIGFSGFYIYQNLLFKPDRAALKDSISKSLDKVL